ncbi:GNAT family N-acetyltransferase [Micromonospora sp. NPDC048930]|uniref:GNAT family N-acetyltransferase n=1 Tax=Micromonospora sp. NPDC048930 TaxID=3364261 RepID=UPI0037210D20
MPELITPTARLHRSWLAARDDWGRGVHQDGSGLKPSDDVDSPEGFADWVRRLRDGADESRPLPGGLVPAIYWWIVEGDEVLGAISLRLRLNDFLRNAGGHIGYGVRPSARRRGVATFALGAALAEAARRGIDRVLVTCVDGNRPSARTIERHGGVLEDVRDTELGRTRRYWIRTR